MTTTRPLLEMQAISKTFPGVRALSGVDFKVGAGEVHALLGENGAGKSTLLKILSGVQQADRGTIRFDGKAFAPHSPHDAQASGIVTIYQEFSLFPSLTIAENVLIGREPPLSDKAGIFGRRLINWREMARRTAAVMSAVGLELHPMRQVADLSVAEQQMVEIARALSMESRLIVMDEPTSALSDKEVQKLFTIIRELKAKGIAIIFVTHRLEEVRIICDRLTVLRDGELVGEAEVASTPIDAMIGMMVGREVERLFAHRKRHYTGETVLEVEGVSRLNRGPGNTLARLHDISFTLNRGEILGLAGLVGAGRTDLARVIFGADPFEQGTIRVDGQTIAPGSPQDAIEAGIGLVPEDRKLQALFLALTVRSNLSMTALDRLSGRFGWVDGKGERALVLDYATRLNVRMADPEQQIANLSGGNQQKVVLARWLALQPKILIVDEPTRGIDVAAKAEVHQLLYGLAESGIGIIAISSELPEIMTVSDRILTMREGRITGEAMAGEASEEKLMELMTLAAPNAGSRAA